MLGIRFAVLVLVIGWNSVVAQVPKPATPSIPTDAWQRVNATAAKERARVAQEYASLFKVEGWQNEELLNLGKLYNLGGQLTMPKRH